MAALRLAGDQLWEARALQERAVGYLSSGSARRAVADLRRAGDLFTANGQELESAEATVNRGLVALRLGDLPEALAYFDEAARALGRLGASEPDLSMHRCAALTAAGLARDAMQEADDAISNLDRIHRPADQAGRTAADRGQLRARRRAAGHGAGPGRRGPPDVRPAGRQWWRAHAELARVSAAVRAGPVTVRLARDAQRCVRELSELGSPDQPLARLATGRAALALGQTAVASEHLAAAAVGAPPARRCPGESRGWPRRCAPKRSATRSA